MNLVFNTFFAGELSEDMNGRFDRPEYYTGCRQLQNMVIKPTGGATLRPGLEHIYGAYNNSYQSRLIGFVHKTDRYVLEFSEQKMRVFKDGAIVLDGASPYELATPWTAAELADLVFAPRGQAIFHPDHDIYELLCEGDDDWTLTAFASQYGPFLEANKNQSLTMTPSATSGDDKTLTASSAYFEAGHVGSLFELTHDVDEVSLDGVFENSLGPPFTQNATSSEAVIKGRWDVRITWRGWGKLKLQRSTDDGSTWKTIKTWDKMTTPNEQTITEAGQEDDDNVRYRFYLDWANWGDPDVNFDPNLVDWWVYQLNPPFCQYSIKAKNTQQTGICRVTGINSTTEADIDILNDFGVTDATSQWKEGAWSPKNGYPARGTVHESRIIALSTDQNPTGIWAGRPFLRREDSRVFYGGSTVEDDDAFWRTIDLEDFNEAQWCASIWPLLIGGDSSVVKAIGAGPDSPMTPSNTTFITQSGMGSASIQPVRISGQVVYAGRNTKSVYELAYSDNAKSYEPEDLTEFASHIAGSGIVEWAFQQQPYPILWAVTSDGDLIGCTRSVRNQQKAWHYHTTEGTIESVAVIPGETDDEVWVSVARTVGGSTVRSIERMKPFSWGSSQRDCFFVDAGTKWDGGAAITITDISVDAGTGKVTVTAGTHGFSNAYKVRIASVAGTTDVNGHVYTVADKTDDTFVLKTRDGSAYIDGSAFGTYTSGGAVERVANSVSSLTQLAGVSVAALLDGQPATGSVNASGVYTVGNGTKDSHYKNTIIVGRSYDFELSPMRPQVNTREGSIQALFKKITYCGVRLHNSAGGKVGTSESDAIDIVYRQRGDAVGADVELTTRDLFTEHPGGWQREGDIWIGGSSPLPFTVTCILFGMEA